MSEALMDSSWTWVCGDTPTRSHKRLTPSCDEDARYGTNRAHVTILSKRISTESPQPTRHQLSHVKTPAAPWRSQSSGGRAAGRRSAEANTTSQTLVCGVWGSDLG